MMISTTIHKNNKMRGFSCILLRNLSFTTNPRLTEYG